MVWPNVSLKIMFVSFICWEKVESKEIINGELSRNKERKISNFMKD